MYYMYVSYSATPVQDAKLPADIEMLIIIIENQTKIYICTVSHINAIC